MKTGTNADESAASATSARTRFGSWNATVNALIFPRGAEVVGRDDLAHEPEHARERRSRPRRSRSRDGERGRARRSAAAPRPASRDARPAERSSDRPGRDRRPSLESSSGRPAHASAVALEPAQLALASASLTAGGYVSRRSDDPCRRRSSPVRRSEPSGARRSAGGSPSSRSQVAARRCGGRSTQLAGAWASSRPHGPLLPPATILQPAGAGVFTPMPNIRQQEKRVRQATRQRVENLRWRSTAKTLMRRLQDAAEDGDAAAVDERHRELVSWLDRAASKGVAPQEHRRPPQGAGRPPRRGQARRSK